MTQSNQALKVALAAAQQLPPKLQKQLAEWLMRAAISDKNTVVVYLQRLSPHKQARLTKLMDKNTEGRLSQAEQLELQRLGAEVDQVLLANSHALARALRPELFDERGRPMKHRFRQALSESSFRRAEPGQEHVRG
jgi:hypothetical protein